MDVFENVTAERSDYESLGNVQTVALGAVGYARVPARLEDGSVQWTMVVSPVRDRLTMPHKVRMLRAAAEVAGGVILERVEAADDATLKRWAGQYVHKSGQSEFKRYTGAAETHASIEREVSYTLDSSGGSVDARLFAVVE